MAQTTLQRNDNASSSSSPWTSYAQYDVFVNHRGPDVKNTFASHLYHRLISRGLRVFLDKPELVEGRTFPSQIEAAIQSAAIHIAIFSPKYAESQWCLDELIHMVKSGATILPVFYNVQPSDLRRTGKGGNGTYAQALRKHEEKERYDSQTIQNWREALFAAANISGFELQAFNGDEGQLLEDIVRRVLNEVDKTPLKFVAEHPTGLKEKLQEFESIVLQRQKEKVVGIVGPGGVGKTTLAKEYFSQRRSHYSRSCFLYDVRENSGNGCLPSLLRKLLKDLTGVDLHITSIDEGIENLIKHLSFSSFDFLIIVDDVDDARQLRPFLPIKNILSSNSLILITSRDKKIPKLAKIPETSVYELKGLDKWHSKYLFCLHAFQQPQPLPEFADLVDNFLIACDGLPLSLKVFGALVFGEDKSYWQEKLNELNNILPNEIHERLQISYDSLSSKDQEIFLDIACFFIGEDRDRVITICGSVGNLQNKCLLEVESEDNLIKMHDHIRTMGRSIAEKVSPRRLWDQTTNNVDDLLERSSFVHIEVRGVKMKFVEDNTALLMSEMSCYKRLIHELFENCLRCPFDYFRFFGILNLQFVAAEHVYLEHIVRRARAPRLQWIRWYNCTHSSLPSWIPMQNLKVLEVHGRKLRLLWERESEAPLHLRELIISAPLSGFPKSMVRLKHLEKIVIHGALFKTLPEELCDVHSLKCLRLYGCSKMISLPDSFAELRNLKELYISDCLELKCLPDSFGLLTQLTKLGILNCPELKWLPDSFRLLTQLKVLEFSNCPELKCLPDSFRLLTQLTKLYIWNCPELKCLPDSFESLPQLTELTLCNCPELKCLPDSCGWLTRLTGLGLMYCPELKCLPDSFGLLPQLTHLVIKKCGIEYFPQDLKMSNLKMLNVEECPLRELPFRRFEAETERELNTLGKCMFHERACQIHGSICPTLQGGCPSLQLLILKNCKELRRIGRLCGLPQLKYISLEGCEKLEELSGVETLISLELLKVVGCAKLEKIEGLWQLRGLKLFLHDCLEIRELGQIRELRAVEHSMLLSARVVNCPKLESFYIGSHAIELFNDSSERGTLEAFIYHTPTGIKFELLQSVSNQN